MTTPTPHGQVPDTLIDLIDTYAEARYRCGGIYNPKTEAARKAVIEALSGVQALSAAPAGWKLAPVNPTPEMWKAAKTVPDPNPPYPPHYGLVWDAMLAATPTPPAEQQAAPKAAPATVSSTQHSQFLSDVLTAAGLLTHGKQCKALGDRLADMVMRLRAAPQQEEQEPVAWLNPWRADRVTTDYDAYGEHGIPLYTAPQPAPDCHHRPPCDECAALAAQGGE